VPNSLFASKFSGRWALELDSNGRIFLDHDPELIEIIVNFLRTKKIENHAMPVPSPEIPDKKKNQFHTILHYFGLTDFFYPPQTILPLDIDNIEVVQSQASAITVTKSEHKMQFSKNNNNFRKFNFVACKPPLDSSGEGSFWKVTIDAVSNDGHDGLLLGIIGQLDASNNSYSHSTSFGWTGGAVFVKGKHHSEHGGWSSGGFSQGECLYFHLKSNKLTMFSVKKNQKFTIDVTTTVNAYYIHFNMYYSGTKITLEPLNEEESACFL